MFNVAYDMPSQPLGIQPYIGAGVGYTWLDTGNAQGSGFATLSAAATTW